jgi:hypothetical protein
MNKYLEKVAAFPHLNLGGKLSEVVDDMYRTGKVVEPELTQLHGGGGVITLRKAQKRIRAERLARQKLKDD